MTSKPFHLMIKPVGAACNLACAYCYYLAKAAYYPGSSFRMGDATLERVVAAYMQSNPAAEVIFGWQGGEPLLAGLDFFRRALELQAKHARPGQRAVNTVQTNGVLINDEWASFFAEHHFLVGISIDGPPELHDHYRRDRRGRPTYDRVVAGLETLRAHKVEHNALVAVNRANAEHPLKVYRHLTGLGLAHLQFIPIVERESSHARKATPWSVLPAAFGRLLCEVFDYWSKHDVGRVFVQIFESTLAVWMGGSASVCVFAPICGSAMAVEHTGDLYACDHFVYPEHLRGEITPGTLEAVVDGPDQRAFGQMKSALSEYCRQCPVLRFCWGDCPKHRGPASEGKSVSYLCRAYRKFFTHSARVLEAMAHEVRAGRPAANVMEILRLGDG